MIKAVIFDCFGVMYSDQLSGFINSASPQVRQQLNDVALHVDLGKITQDEMLEQYAKLTNMPVSQVRDWLYGPKLVRDQALLDYSQQLRKQYKVGMISNASPGSMDKYFTQDERKKYFDDVVVSCEVDLIKPWPQIYLLAAERLGIAPQEAVFVDDSSLNCDGAQKVGMHAIVYAGLQQLQNDIAVLL